MRLGDLKSTKAIVPILQIGKLKPREVRHSTLGHSEKLGVLGLKPRVPNSKAYAIPNPHAGTLPHKPSAHKGNEDTNLVPSSTEEHHAAAGMNKPQRYPTIQLKSHAHVGYRGAHAVGSMYMTCKAVRGLCRQKPGASRRYVPFLT